MNGSNMNGGQGKGQGPMVRGDFDQNKGGPIAWGNEQQEKGEKPKGNDTDS
jgi:hypothetical protein